MSGDRQGATSQKQRGEPVTFQDWEPRALPSEARCRVWYETGGRLLVTWASGVVTTLEPVDGAFSAPGKIVNVRPWKDNNPIPWSEFFSATHPPIPEGWEAVGDFDPDPPGRNVHSAGIEIHPAAIVGFGRYHSGDGFSTAIRRILPAIPEGWEAVGEWRKTDAREALSEDEVWFLDSGALFRTADGIRDGYAVRVRRVPPPADWGDVPKGVELRPDCGFGGARNEVVINGAHVGRVFDKTDGVYHTHTTNHEPVAGSPFASLPAAIVALTGRRTG